MQKVVRAVAQVTLADFAVVDAAHLSVSRLAERHHLPRVHELGQLQVRLSTLQRSALHDRLRRLDVGLSLLLELELLVEPRLGLGLERLLVPCLTERGGASLLRHGGRRRAQPADEDGCESPRVCARRALSAATRRQQS